LKQSKTTFFFDVAKQKYFLSAVADIAKQIFRRFKLKYKTPNIEKIKFIS
jgi:hypothetical protein